MLEGSYVTLNEKGGRFHTSIVPLRLPFSLAVVCVMKKSYHLEKAQSIRVLLLRQNSKRITKNLSKQKAKNKDSHK